MKKILALHLVIAILTVVNFSCQKTELEFSCDPHINKFVKKNIVVLQQTTLSELNEFNVPLQRAIFNSWDYHKKREIWFEKLQYLLLNSDFNKLEVDQIQILIDHIDEDYFLEKDGTLNSLARSQFADEWINYASHVLGWSDMFIAFVIYRLYTEPDQLESELSALKSFKSTALSDTEYGYCDCNISNDFCGLSECLSGDCTTINGCGWLWSMTCNGNCY